MRVGMSLSSSVVGADPAEGARWMIERARTAWAVGLDSLSLGDHHVRRAPYYQNTPMLGRLLAEWGARPAGCLFLLPLWNPVLVAEHVGTLAALAQGPFVVQTGIGGGQAQFDAMGADLGTRGRVLEQAIVDIKALLAGETVGSAAVDPLPAQPVEWWVGAGAPVALDRAARLGDAWYGGPGLTLASAPSQLAIYREACERHGATPRAIARKDLVILADGDRARRLGHDLLAAGYRGFGPDHVIMGDPADAAEQLAGYEQLGFADVIARCMAVPQADAVETIESLGEVRTLLAGA